MFHFDVNTKYLYFLETVQEEGVLLEGRNGATKSHIHLPVITFDETPLITLRKTAWKKALQEMEWFMSGESKCPDELLDWWEGQLNEDNALIDGYPWQFRLSSSRTRCSFDQVAYILQGLQSNPNSRRLLLSSWNPGDMAVITEANNNPKTPTSCHSIVVQFFVRNGALHMKSYQRSADMLLGTPHNWIQSWGMLLYFAYHTNLRVGSLQWIFGDAHIYQEESHLKCLKEMTDNYYPSEDVQLRYEPKGVEYDDGGVPIFKASDFFLEGSLPEKYASDIRPKLM